MRRLPFLALAVLLFSNAAAYANHPPVTVDFTFRFDVEIGNQQHYKSLAPWYTYFPYDPNIHGRAPHFPTWPPTSPTGAPAPGPTGRVPGPMLPPPGAPASRVTWQPQQPMVTPVSYSPVYYGAPSYWYGR